MKVYLSVDMEGVAGVVDWEQCRPGAVRYDEGCELLLGEVNAAIEGAVEAGATHVVVNDAHGRMANLPPAGLAHRASYLSGRVKPMYMMEGLDASFDAVLLVGYHGSMGRPSTLSHTYSPAAVSEVRLDGEVCGEAGVNSLVTRGLGVPIVLVTGDEVTAEETRRVAPSVVTAVVKRSVSRFAAESLHPEAARELIRERAAAAVRGLATPRPAAAPVPAGSGSTLELSFVTSDYCELATRVAGAQRTGDRSVAMSHRDPVELFRRFVTVVLLCRGLGE